MAKYKPVTSETQNLAIISLLLLIISLVATIAGSIWTILSPIDGGVNFAAGFLYMGGMLLSVVSIVLGIVSFVSLTRKDNKR